MTDQLTDVFDDAPYNDNVDASAGVAVVGADTLSWSGDLDVDQDVTITYSVTVTSLGDGELLNLVTTTDTRGVCVPAADQNEDCTTRHLLGDYNLVKSSDPETGSSVAPGETVTYTVTVTQIGPAPVVGASFVDNLSEVLDDATFVENSIQATAGTATFDEVAGTLSWSGDLDVGDFVTVTYSVTVKDIAGLEADGDALLTNVVTTPGRCVPSDDRLTPCTTEHPVGWYEYSKTSVPTPGSTVGVGDTVTYTVEVAERGQAPVMGATLSDTLADVLDDATYVADSLTSSSGTASIDEAAGTLSWTGDLAVDQIVTIEYSVTVTDDGDGHLLNVVTTTDNRGACVPAADENPDCTTEHHTPEPNAPGLEILKDVDRTVVELGGTVNYTITATNTGGFDYTAETPAVLVDDLSDVLDDAAWVGNAAASTGTVSFTTPELTWSGPLAAGDSVTITYSVRVNDTVTGSRELNNTVIGPPISNCPPANPAGEAVLAVAAAIDRRLSHRDRSRRATGAAAPGDSGTCPRHQLARSGPPLRRPAVDPARPDSPRSIPSTTDHT